MFSADAAMRRRLFLARESGRFTQQEAADAVGMTRQKLSRCERGDSSPTLEQFRDLCTLYGVAPGYIMFGVMSVAPELARVMRSAAAAGVQSDPVSDS